jgi:hypothetical protein
MISSAALDKETQVALEGLLLRDDGQEDVCFALWHPSTGATRSSALVSRPIAPKPGDRQVHGNASFNSQYVLRAANIAQEFGAGLVLLHSHPGGSGWQGMSADDVAAERGYAAQAQVLTGLPLVGLTMAGDGALSGRAWTRAGRGLWERAPFGCVRLVGTEVGATFDPVLRPAPQIPDTAIRTVSAWGAEIQALLGRLRIGIVGAGSVGCIVAEILARTGVGHIVLLDFDTVERHNLDRLLHANARDVRLARAKVHMLAGRLRAHAIHPEFRVDALEHSVVEREGFAAAADCDVLFSCVDRPWPRHALNLLAYAHLIPVVDGGIAVRNVRGRLRRADWRAHLASPGRRCLTCLGQYDVADVALEREGYLDDPHYIQGLADDHPGRRSENVMAFSSSVASMEVVQMLTAIVAPGNVPDVGAHIYHFGGGRLDRDIRDCDDECPFARELVGMGDHCDVDPTGHHAVAVAVRADRRRRRTRWVRAVDRIDTWLARGR